MIISNASVEIIAISRYIKGLDLLIFPFYAILLSFDLTIIYLEAVQIRF